jgi:CrcB protein
MRAELFPYLWVFLGAGIGGALRHGVNRAGLAIVGPGFPAGTLFVNIVGCFAMGLLAGFFAYRGELTSPATRLFLTTGVLGGFTTFSAFSLDAAVLWQRGQMGVAVGYVAASVLVSIAAVFFGLWVGRTLFQ